MPASSYRTPGVYIAEADAFGNAIVGIATAVPIFIGYTAFAGDPASGKALYGVPVPLSSMADFEQHFGGPAPFGLTISPLPAGSGETPALSAAFTTQAAGAFAVTQTGFRLAPQSQTTAPNRFNLYWSMQAFFANGGAQCYVVSAGSYWMGQSPTAQPDPVPTSWTLGTIALGDAATGGSSGLAGGLSAAGFALGPTMIVIPEACQLNPSDYATLAGAMLSQAGTLQDRVAILDLPACLSADSFAALRSCQDDLWRAIAPQATSFSYGAAYAPALNSSVIPADRLLYTDIAGVGEDNATVNTILTTAAYGRYAGDAARLALAQGAIAAAFPLPASYGAANGPQYSVSTAGYPSAPSSPPAALAQWQRDLHSLLLNDLPVFRQIEDLVAGAMNILPPSPFLAGVWTRSDRENGVWNSPANIALDAVASPLYAMNDTEQADFNMPTNGEAISVIRAFPGRGTVVWGARTLDGNSADYRYIQVRRTLIYIEQSIKTALQPYVFAANDATTWSTVTAAITNFLTGLWQQGGLMGATASEAFKVTCGLGSTLTSQDILNGYMIVAVTLQMIHPAEFIELTFKQTMAS